MRNLRSAIYGLAVGDALGVPVEFMKRGSFRVEDMTGFGTHSQPCGTWSDDTSMTLATCHSIKELGCIDVDDIRRRFGNWLYNGEYAIDGNVFDVGGTTSAAIRNGKGEDGEYSNGNGSLMRILPLAFTDADYDIIGKVSAITHAHRVSIQYCIYYVRIARALLGGENITKAVSIYKDYSEITGRVQSDVLSSGFVVDTLEAALWCLCTTDNFKDAVLRAVNLGDDTDTVGAVTGGLAGIVYGIENIPKSWLDKLRGKDLIESCLWDF